jgi:glucokinase
LLGFVSAGLVVQSPANPNSQTDLIFVADLGGTHLRTATVDQCGKIQHRFKQSTPRSDDPAEIVSALLRAVKECERQLVGTEATISGVSVAVPGTVDFDEGVVLTAPNVPSLNDFGLGAALTRHLKWPAIIENDANAAAAGEMWQGAGRGYRHLICVTLGTGVGGGIILDGKLWRGADGSAGEIGHVAVDPFAGVPCSCGSSGCLEVYASATAIVRMAREAGPKYPDSKLQLGEGLTSEKIYQAGLLGDELALEVLRRMGTYLGVGLATLVNLLNPEIIVIGGGVSYGWDLFEKQMNQEVRERAFPIPAESVKITRAECGDDAGLLGAAHLAFGMR